MAGLGLGLVIHVGMLHLHQHLIDAYADHSRLWCGHEINYKFNIFLTKYKMPVSLWTVILRAFVIHYDPNRLFITQACCVTTGGENEACGCEPPFHHLSSVSLSLLPSMNQHWSLKLGFWGSPSTQTIHPHQN